MKKQNALVFILLLSIILVGCGSDDGVENCKKKSDCQSKSSKFFKISCIDKECSYSPNPDVCGNDKCEGSEKCTSCSDCKKEERCEGKVGDYLTKKCNVKNQCQTTVKDSSDEKITETFDIKERNQPAATVAATFDYQTPFNLDETNLRATIKLSKIDDKVSYVKLKTIEVGLVSGRDTKTLAILESDKFLFDTANSIIEDIKLDLTLTEEEIRKASLNVKLNFEYDFTDTRDTLIRERSFDKKFNVVFVDPTLDNIKCNPRNCDDDNTCTIDICYPGTSICKHELKSGPCLGNFICDPGENKCSAPQDCGRCSGKVTSSTEYQCISNQCQVVISGTSEKKTLTKERSIPSTAQQDIKFRVLQEFQDPFNTNSDQFTLTFEVLDLKQETTNFEISRIELRDGNLLLGETTNSQGFSQVGDKNSYQIAVSHRYTESEVSKTPEITVRYGYSGIDNRGQPQTYTNKDYKESLGKITFLTLQ